MRGIELAERFFRECGAPRLEDQFPWLRERAAGGLVGDGSECFGFDDDLSRDHDWGPGFCLWLDPEDHARHGQAVQEAYDRLPTEFAGLGPRAPTPWGARRIGVFETGQFYARFIGLPRLPRGAAEWLPIPETHLAACTNGAMFADPLGVFSEVRAGLLAFYPRDVWLKKLAARCMAIGQAGQYNLARCLERGEDVAAHQAEAQFVRDSCSLVFLLNRRYMPFYKWMHRAVEPLPILGMEIHRLLRQLVAGTSGAWGEDPREQKLYVVAEICAAIAVELRRQDLSDAPGDLLLGHGPSVQRRIQEPWLRQLDVWVG